MHFYKYKPSWTVLFHPFCATARGVDIDSFKTAKQNCSENINWHFGLFKVETPTKCFSRKNKSAPSNVLDGKANGFFLKKKCVTCFQQIITSP